MLYITQGKGSDWNCVRGCVGNGLAIAPGYKWLLGKTHLQYNYDLHDLNAQYQVWYANLSADLYHM